MTPFNLLCLLFVLSTFQVQAQSKGYAGIVYDGVTYHAFTLVVDDSLHSRFSFADAPMLKNIHGASMEVFSISAGYAQADCTPLGLALVDGKRLQPLDGRSGQGNFYLKPNGVLAISPGKARIQATTRYQISPEDVWALQSGPLLLERGKVHPEFNPDSPNRQLRSGVGMRKVGAVYELVFLVSAEPVRFHDFAVAFRDFWHCDDALLLGSGSSELRIPHMQAFTNPGQIDACRYIVIAPAGL